MTAVLLLGAVGCERRAWTGPLASAADSVFPVAPPVGCDTASVNPGFDRVELPLRFCRSSRGDTTYSVLADDRRRVLILTRAVTVDSARQMAVHDSLQFAIATQYEAPAICPESDGAAEREVRVWKTLDRQITLKSLMATRIVVELRVNHPGCPVGG